MPFILSRRDAVYLEIGQREGSCGEIRVSRLHSLSKQLHRSFKLAIIYLIAIFMHSWYTLREKAHALCLTMKYYPTARLDITML